jgi:hypothetical protein
MKGSTSAGKYGSRTSRTTDAGVSISIATAGSRPGAGTSGVRKSGNCPAGPISLNSGRIDGRISGATCRLHRRATGGIARSPSARAASAASQSGSGSAGNVTWERSAALKWIRIIAASPRNAFWRLCLLTGPPDRLLRS